MKEYDMSIDVWTLYNEFLMEKYPDEIRCEDDLLTMAEEGRYEDEFYEANPMVEFLELVENLTGGSHDSTIILAGGKK